MIPKSTPRRFLVADLFFGDDHVAVGDWIDGNHKPEKNGKFLIKYTDGKELYAYFFNDCNNFYDCVTREPLENETFQYKVVVNAGNPSDNT